MGRLIQTNQALLVRGKHGKLVYDISKEPEVKTPGFNQSVVAYTDTDGKSKWVNVDTDQYGGVLYGGKRFSSAGDLIPTLLTPVTPSAPTVTTPTPKAPASPPPVNLSTAFPVTAPVRAAAGYAGKALSGVGSAFANVAGRIAETAEARREMGIRAAEQLTDAAAQRYYAAEDGQKDTALKNYQTRLSLWNQARKQPETAKKMKEAFYGISDELTAASGKFQEAAEKNIPDSAALRGVLNVVTDLVPFFALNAVPVVGQAAAGAYLVGESTGNARRAGLSGQSQAALGLVSLLSMGAAGQVGKALGGEKVTNWFLKNGMGPELARVLEQAAVSGLASGATRQAVSAGGQAFAHAEQVRNARANLDALSKMDTSQLTSEEKAAYESAVSANQAVLSAGGVDFTSALKGIAFEMVLSIAGTGIRYAFNRGQEGPNFTTSEPTKRDLKPSKSEYFKGVRTEEDAKARLRQLSRQYHPDISDNPDATAIMQKINDEYGRLILNAQKVTRTWRKAKAGRGVTKTEADAANGAITALLDTARASGDAEGLTALENILAPMAAEINAAPIVPEVPAAPLTPDLPAAPEAYPAASWIPPQPAAEVAPSVPQAPAAGNLPAFSPVPERRPFITFEDWRTQHPEIVERTEAAAREELSGLTAAPSEKRRMSMEDFTNMESPVWNYIDYNDEEARNTITRRVHQEMTDAGQIVEVPEDTRSQVSGYYPDLRAEKKRDRTPKLQEAMKALKGSLRQFLRGLKGSYEFEVNGRILEAQLYDTGVKEVMKQITREKASMLYHSAEIFRNAQYLYSTAPDHGAADAFRWNYFYSPVKIGENIFGVRIAVRDVMQGQEHQPESQIYHWGINKGATLDGGKPDKNVSSPGVSSVTPTDSIPQPAAESKSGAEHSGTVDKTEIPQTPRPAAPESGPLRDLIDGLNQYDRVDVGGLRFEIRRGRDYTLAQIRRIDPTETPYIQNAANDVWRDFLPTPEAARDALIDIARNLPSFAVDKRPPDGYPVGQTEARSVPDIPEEVTGNERHGTDGHEGQGTLADVPDGAGVQQSPVLGPVASGLDGALEAEGVQAPEGTGDARGVVRPDGRRDTGDSGRQQGAGRIGRAGNREGTLSDEPGAGRGPVLGNQGVLTPERSGTPETVSPTPTTETPEISREPETASPAETPESPAPESGKKAAGKKSKKAKTAAKATETAPEAEQPPTPEARTKQEIEEKRERSAAPKGRDFTFPEGGLQLPNGEKSRAKANLEAIRILRTLESEGRPATAAEQEALSKFVGWGGLSDIFDEHKDGWEALRGQLKELLSEEEYAAAAKSTMNAHYTSQEVIQGVYDALTGIGFQGGRVLEPSAGIGHFNGAMPANLRGKSRWTMVELDPVTGGIARALYPNADVRVQGFETSLLPDDYFDAAISNVPFGDLRIFDKNYPSFLTHSIHNYFFAKALDKVRPGGIVAFITSRYTMDSYQSDVRKYLGTKADLLGAVRLPDTAFRANAGTDVVADILILRKRAPNTPYAGEKFTETNYQTFRSRDGYANGYVNQYFQKHPEMVLGVMDKGSMWRGDSLTWRPKDTNKSLREQIAEAFATVTERMTYPVSRSREDIRAEIRADAAKGKAGGLVKRDGKIYRNADGKLAEASDIPKTKLPRLSAILAMRDGAHALLDFQARGAPESVIETSRKGLNAMYDDFLKHYGPLHENQSVVKLDLESAFILSLENYDKDTRTATKADIFTKNTIAPDVTVTHVDTLEDALTVSLNETGTVGAERIAALTGQTPEAVTKSLLERGLAFLNRDGNLETAEQYLSGNVRAKLKDAKALAEGNPEYRRNVEALEKIIPPDIEAENIKAQIGVTWIPDEIYSIFAGEMTRQYGGISVSYNGNLGEYRVEVSRSGKQDLKTSALNTVKWGTKDKTFVEILSATLNNKDLNVWRKKSDGSRILDSDATAAAKQKAKEIQAEFQDWLFREPERREALTRLYNDLFNNSVTPRYDGSKLEIRGMNTGITLNPHQKNAVWRIINSGGNTLLAHRVGAGKTYEMAAAAMKLRELGIVKKPMFVVPKSLTGQWGREFLDLFPNAKVLTPGDDFSAANRKEYVNRIATGDYDAVILSYEQFKTIPMSDKSRAGFIKEQIDQLSAALEQESLSKTGRSPSVKQMEKKKANLETELKKLMDKKEDSDNINFEALGVDSLFVDEAHNMKNLFYTTHMNNVTGLGNKEGSQQAFDLYMKTRYLQRLNGGRGIVFATATPVMNSVVEMYTMQNYLQPDALAARGIHNFDAWANQFAEVRTELQISPSGQGGRMKDTLSRYNNLNALQQMFAQFMDVVTDIPGLKIPKMKGGKRIVVECEPSEYQLNYMKELARRAEALKSGHVDPKVDNILKIGNDGRKISYSQRVMDPSLPYEPGGKIMKCAENVARIWKETAAKKGTQIIFCDYSTPKSGAAAAKKGAEAELAQAEAALDAKEEAEAMTIYQDLKNILIGMGIPGKEIAFIHDAKNVEQRNQLFDAMNGGRVRVLIGSTGKMGVGMNAQRRVTDLHHLDAPQRPGDVEQREGRALRQHNMNDEVGVYTYITKNTFDARSWDILQRKWTFIVQLTSGDFSGNSFEGDSDVLSAAEIKAIASGNPLIQEQFQLTADIAALEGLERAHRREVFDAQDKLKAARSAIAADTDTAARLRADIATRRDTSGKAFAVTLDGKTVTERKAAGEQLIRQAKKFLKPGQSPETTKKIGTFAGFDLLTTSGGELLLRGQGQYRSAVNFESAVGTVQSLEAAAKRLDAALSAVEKRLAENKASVPELEKASAAPFAQSAELEQKRKRAAEILTELSDERKPSASGETDSASGTPETSAFRETAPGSVSRETAPEVSAFRDSAPAWEIVDDESGVLRFRDTAAAKSAKAATMGNHAERWTAERVGDTDVTPGRGADFIRKWEREWANHVTFGHVRGARGQYQRKGSGIGSGGIRLKIAGDVPVFIHEVGHALDDKYQLTANLSKVASDMDEKVRLSKEGQDLIRERLKIRQELTGNLDTKFAAQYKEEELVGEGMAEFFRRFCQDRLKVEADYPKTVEYIMTTLSGDDIARLLVMADEANAIYALDTETAQSSVRRMADKAVDYRGFWERAGHLKDVIIQAAADTRYSVKKLSHEMGSDVWKEFYNAVYADGRAYFNLTEYLADLKGKRIGPGLTAVLRLINCNDQKEYDAFGEYLILRNAPSWIADEKRVLANDRKNNLLYCELRQAELEKQYPQFRTVSEMLYKFWDKFMTTYAVNTGLISKEQYDAARRKHPYYVPFFRVMDDVKAARNGFATHRTFANQPNPMKRAKGSGRDLIHPVDSIINAVAKFTYQGIHQQAMLDLIDVADAYGLEAAFMERVPAPVIKQTANIAGIKAEIAERVTNSDLPDKDVELLLNILDEQKDLMEWYTRRNRPDEDCIIVRRNGEPEYYRVNDELLFESLSTLGRPQLSKYVQPLNKITRFVSSMLTGADFTWNIFYNIPRDFGTAFTYAKNWNHRARLLPNIIRSYGNSFFHAIHSPNVDPLYMEYLALGGGGSSAWAMDKKLSRKILYQPTTAKEKTLEMLKTPFRFIEWIGRTGETGPRFATYAMWREDGADVQTAFRAAMEVTVDFKQGGIISRTINAFAPFINAGTQAVYKYSSVVIGADVPKQDRAKVLRGRWTHLLSASLIIAVIGCWLNLSSEEKRKNYRRLSTYVKNNFFCIPVEDGKYKVVPKPREITIPENIFRAAIEEHIGENPHAYDGFWGYAAPAAFPNGVSELFTLNQSSLEGTITIIGAMNQVWANKDFRGIPIETTKDQSHSPWERYDGSTSKVAKLIANTERALGVPREKQLSPKQIDFLGNNVLGAPWRYQKALLPGPVDPKKRDWTLGVQSKLNKDSLYSQESVNRLFNMEKASSQDATDDPTNIDKEITAFRDSTMKSFYNTYYALARNERNEEDETREDRRVRDLVLTEVEMYTAAREEDFFTAEEQAVYEICRKAGTTDKKLPGAKRPKITDGDGSVHNLTAKQYYDYQGNFNNIYWNLVKEALPQVSSDAEKEAVLKSALDAAAEMAENHALMNIGAATTKEYKRYEDLQLYSVPISTYLVAKAKVKDIESLKDKRTEKTIPNSDGALIAEAVREMDLDLPATNRNMLLSKLGVSDTVLGWSDYKLERELRKFHRASGTE